MKCKTCVSEGKKSSVYPGPSSSTCMGWQAYYDEEGVYHNHDPNWISTSYSCSRGHEWKDSRQAPCPNCDYGKEKHDG